MLYSDPAARHETIAMNKTARLLRSLLIPSGPLLLVVMSCSPHIPTEPGGPSAPVINIPAGDGGLAFIDSGCSCENPPWPPIQIYVDGKKVGDCPTLGSFGVALKAGAHMWSDDQGDGPTTVYIPLGGTVTINLFTNLGCTDGCSTGDPNNP
jgi:hypothetical protein